MYIRVIDLETTHETPETGGVVEIGYCDLHASRFDLLGAPVEYDIDLPKSLLTYPGVPIPPETSAIHHLIDADVCDAPPWREELKRVVSTECAPEGMIGLAAHSANFEQLWTAGLPMVPWLCTYKLALRFWPDAPNHKNMTLRYYKNPPGLERARAVPAHRAGPDAYVTAHLLRILLEDGNRDGQLTIDQAAQISAEPALLVKCNIGVWRGKPWSEVDDGFMNWILSKDFDADTRHTCRYWLDRRQKEWEDERAKGGG